MKRPITTSTTARKALVYFQHNPWPARTGAHQRCLAFLKALRACNYEVVLFGSNIHTDTQWRSDWIHALEQHCDIKVQLYRASHSDLRFASQIRWDQITRPQWGHFAPAGLKKAFARFAEQYQPDLATVVYTHFGDMIDNPVFKNTVTMMETLDLYSLSVQMQGVLSSFFPAAPVNPSQIPEFLLDDQFLTNLHLEAWPEEYAVCDKYHSSIIVSPAEARATHAHTHKTSVALIPITAETRDIDNTYKGKPLFLAALNMLNVQGYLYFARRVLPLILLSRPRFSLDVAGSCSKYIQSAPQGIIHRGFVDSMTDLYKHTPFAVCPLLGATGQQIKVIEAMSMGVPVIVHKNVADSSPVIHGVNGYIAESHEEFAHYALLLNEDRNKCRELGRAAKETVERAWSQKVFNERLEKLLYSPPARHDVAFLPAPTRSPAAASQSLEQPVCIIVKPSRSRKDNERTLHSLISQRLPDIQVLWAGKRPYLTRQNITKILRIKCIPSLHRAVRIPQGCIFGVLQGGDILMPDALQFVKTCFNHSPAATSVEGRFSLLSTSGQPQWISGSPAAADRPLHNAWLRRAAIFFKPDNSVIKAMRTKRLAPQWFEHIINLLQSTGSTAFTDMLIGGIPAIPCPSVTVAESKRFSDNGPAERVLITPAPAQVALHRQTQLLAVGDISKYMNTTGLPESNVSNAKTKHAFFRRMVQATWRSLRFKNEKVNRIALFGAGFHTHWLLSIVPREQGPQVVAILDDFADEGRTIKGIPVLRAAGFDPKTVDAIIPSTDTSTKLFVKRCRSLYGKRVPLWYLYKGLPNGPYPKTA